MSLSVTVSTELWSVGIRSKLIAALATLANNSYWLVKQSGYLVVGGFEEWQK